MTITPRLFVPYAHVGDVTRSIDFYRRLGFTVGNTFVPEGETVPSWAWLESGNAKLMVAKADGPLQPDAEGVLFYLYFDDVAAARSALESGGIRVGPMKHPFYAPDGEFRVVDPDGYSVMVMQV